MEMQKLFDRTIEVAATPAGNVVRQRLGETAESLSLAGDMQMHLDIATASMVALISVLYTTDSDGRPANIDTATYRILLRPLPWGETGWRKWGLRRWEGACLRRLLLDRVGVRRRLPALFDYNEYSRQWHVNANIYPDPEAALRWLKKDGPSLAEWRSIVMTYRAQAHARMQRLRG
jgi:hypothetical protein